MKSSIKLLAILVIFAFVLLTRVSDSNAQQCTGTYTCGYGAFWCGVQTPAGLAYLATSDCPNADTYGASCTSSTGQRGTCTFRGEVWEQSCAPLSQLLCQSPPSVNALGCSIPGSRIVRKTCSWGTGTGPSNPPQICTPGQWHPDTPNCGLETCGPSQSAQCNTEGTGWVCINNPELCTPTPPPSPPTTSNNPSGNTDLANCSVIAGWSCDRDNPDAQIQVAVFNGPYDSANTSNFLGYFPANVGGGNGADSEAIAAACGSTNANIGHRFVVTFPQEWINGQVYNIHVYAINIGGGQNVLIGSPISVNTATCLATTAPTATPLPSPTPSGACQLVRAYRPTGDLGIASNWGSPLTAAQLAQLRAGDTVYFTVVGNVTGGNVTAGRIRVNASTWTTRDVTTSFKPNASGVDSSIREYYRAYVVPANTYSFTVAAEIYSPALDTNTDMNDGNLGWR